MPYEKLLAWKVAHQLALETYTITENWPRNELYGLTAQTRRAALSIPTNIAEGVAKSGPREFRRYLDIQPWVVVRALIPAAVRSGSRVAISR
jgi:hypothetical protein